MGVQDGIILLDKEGGISSAGALNKLKRLLKPRKIGHAGTLDPAATGLLVCLLGKTTKLADYVQEGRKIYSGTILFGVQTDTDDATGNIIAQTEELPPFSDVLAVARTMVGESYQLPPSVSALKINGKRAYDLVRQGVVPELAARRIEITSFELTFKDERRCEFIVHCSKGTYIRSIARDLGERLGCLGTLESLRREASLPFRVEDARRLSDISIADVMPWSSLVGKEQWVELNEVEEKKVSNGDERLLPALLERATCLTPSVALIGYQREGDARGVLLKRGETWSFGPYFGGQMNVNEDGAPEWCS